MSHVLWPDIKHVQIVHCTFYSIFLNSVEDIFKTCTGAAAEAGQLGTSEFLVDTARSRLQELLV